MALGVATNPVLHASVTSEGGGHSWTLEIYPGSNPNPGFRERCVVEIEIPAGSGWVLIVDDETLSSTIRGSWIWQPDFFAGRVRAELERDGKHVGHYLLDVSPDPGKLSMEWYEEILGSFRNRAPDWVIGSEPGSRQWGTAGFAEDPWVQFRRLRLHAPAFLQALRAVTRGPIRSQRTTRAVVPVRRARRVDARTVRAAAANGTLGYLCQSPSENEVDVAHASEPLYEVPWNEEHLDGPANRCLTALLLSLIRRARILRSALGDRVDQDSGSGVRSGLQVRWERRRRQLDSIAAELSQMLKREPFSCVTRPEITSAGLTSIAAHPDYSRAYGAGWRATRSGIEGVDETELMWLCPTWELYERWCYVEVCRYLERHGVQKTSESRGARQARFTGTSRAGDTVSLYFQKKFGAKGGHASAPAFHSISRERIPDLVITVDGIERQRFAAVDAKYRASRPNILDAMASAHIYHDSLRWHGKRPDVSVLLVPAAENVAWLEDTAFIDQECVGVAILRPSSTADSLDAILTRLLN